MRAETPLPGDPAALARRRRFRVSLAGLPVRTMVLWLVLIGAVFATRNRWAAWRLVRSFPGEQSTLSADHTTALCWSGRKARLWDIASGRHLAASPVQSQDIEWAQLSPDHRRILLLLRGNSAVLYDGMFRTAVACFEPPQYSFGYDFVAGGRYHVAGVDIGEVEVRCTETGRLIYGGVGDDWDVSPDGRRLVVAGLGRVVLVDLPTGRPVGALPIDLPLYSDVHFSADGRRIVIIRRPTLHAPAESVQVWDAVLSRRLRSWENTGSRASISFPRARYLFVGDRRDSVLVIWDLVSDVQIARLEAAT
ncbi:MAG: WD40 repeat domain-containing protein, partial [Planctomycetota bacterium]